MGITRSLLRFVATAGHSSHPFPARLPGSSSLRCVSNRLDKLHRFSLQTPDNDTGEDELGPGESLCAAAVLPAALLGARR